MNKDSVQPRAPLPVAPERECEAAATGKERPILFSAPMVRAILEGRKTQTRRTIKLKTGDTFDERALVGAIQEWRPVFDRVANGVVGKESVVVRCPYGMPGDRLWVRETWGAGCRPDPSQGWRDGIEYRADCVDDCAPPLHEIIPDSVEADSIRPGWHPSIHMPRWASRIDLRVTGVRVERLRDISDADALAEGIKHWGDGFHWEPNDGWPGEPAGLKSMRFVGRTAHQAYMGLWEEINGRESLDANPWVWAVSFEPLSTKEPRPQSPLSETGLLRDEKS